MEWRKWKRRQLLHRNPLRIFTLKRIDLFATAHDPTFWFAMYDATASIDFPALPHTPHLTALPPHITEMTDWLWMMPPLDLMYLPHPSKLIDPPPHLVELTDSPWMMQPPELIYLPNLPHLPQLTDSQPHKASRKATKNRKIDCTCGNCLPHLPQLTDSQPHKASRKETKNRKIDCTCRNCLPNLPQLTDSQPHKASPKATERKPQNRLHLPQLPAKPAAIDWLAAAQGKPKDNKKKPKNRKIDCTCHTCRNCLPNLPHLPQLTAPLPHKANHRKIDCTCRTCRNCLPHLPHLLHLLTICTAMMNSSIRYCNTAATASFSILTERPQRPNSLHNNQQQATTKTTKNQDDGQHRVKVIKIWTGTVVTLHTATVTYQRRRAHENSAQRTRAQDREQQTGAQDSKQQNSETRGHKWYYKRTLGTGGTQMILQWHM
jgi:hypothetical protein